MFLKYNLRALNYSVESLQPVLMQETFRYPNTQKRDLEGEDEKFIINHMIRMIFTRCSGILVFTLQFCFTTSRSADLLVNLNKLLMSELNKYLWWELRVEVDHESRS